MEVEVEVEVEVAEVAEAPEQAVAVGRESAPDREAVGEARAEAAASRRAGSPA